MKKLYIFTAFYFCFNILNAQQWDWAMHINGAAMGDMDQDASGNIYTSVVLSSAPPYSTEVRKLDPMGNQIWIKTIDCFINDIAVGTNSIALGGYFNGAVTIEGQPLSSVSGRDGLLIALDLNGTLKWLKQSSGIGDDNITSLALNGSDEVFVTNISDTVTNFGGVTFAKGLAVCVFGSTGSLSNNFHVNFQHPTSGGLVIDAADNIYLKGVYRDSVITIGSTVITNSDTYYGAFYIAKMNRNGTEYWAKHWGSQFRRGLSNIAIANSGEFYMTSMTTYVDEYLNKYSPAGTLIWSKMFGAHTYSGIRDIKLDSHANLYVTGSSWMVADIGSCSLSGSDNFLFLAKADSSGNCLWTQMGDAPTTNAGVRVSIKGNKPVLLGNGAASETVQLGSVSAQGTYFLASVSENLVDVNEFSSNANSSAYPNPSSGIFTVQLEKSKIKEICIYDCLGRCVYDKQAINTSKIDISDKPKGIYLLKITNDLNETFNQRIIVN
ncbi:MAG: hypothetical protein K0Q95_1020 [Bacteroidota bacterium]|jgi:hypothetical protein|nr:hypothetical protein [Bacteroidota bacterium]